MSLRVTELMSDAIPTEDVGVLVIDHDDYPGYLVSVVTTLDSADPGVLYVWTNQPNFSSSGTLTGWNVGVFNTDSVNTHTFKVFIISEV